MRDNAQISDLSSEGCRVKVHGVLLQIGGRVVIRPEGLEGLTGIVRWVDGHEAGIEFDCPLYGPVVDHLSAIHAVSVTRC